MRQRDARQHPHLVGMCEGEERRHAACESYGQREDNAERETVVGKDKDAYLSAYRIHNAASPATRRANGRLFLAQ